MLVYIILSALALVLIPSSAYAWGPGTHIEIALSLLEKLALFTPAVRIAVAGRKKWFLYGSVAADVIVGKKYAGPLHHCHNWRIGEQILKAASTDRERAAAYGYLAHLAADVVAHNYFIPFKIIKNYRARLLSHTYWEMRFDMHVSQGVWDEMKKIIMDDFSPFDRLLESVLKRALFSFKVSKRIFSSILALQRFKQFRRTAGLYAKKSRYLLDTKDAAHYMHLALASASGFLSDPDGAACLRCDPTGSDLMEQAKRVRRHLKKLVRRRQISTKESAKFLAEIKKQLYDGVHQCLSISQR